MDETFKIKASYSGVDSTCSLTWKHNGKLLSNDMGLGIAINSTDSTCELVINNALKEQSGKYTFEVADENSSAEVTFYIVVIGKFSSIHLLLILLIDLLRNNLILFEKELLNQVFFIDYLAIMSLIFHHYGSSIVMWLEL